MLMETAHEDEANSPTDLSDDDSPLPPFHVVLHDSVAASGSNFFTIDLTANWASVELSGTKFPPIPNRMLSQGPVNGICKGVIYRTQSGQEFPGNWPLSISWNVGETISITGSHPDFHVRISAPSYLRGAAAFRLL